MTKQEFHARIWAKLIDFNRKLGLVAPGDRILIAVSGGPDSVCLADYLNRLSRKMRLTLTILHLNHGLRGKDADRDAAFVSTFGKRLGVRTITKPIPVRKHAQKSGRGIEDAARRLRYQAFGEAAAGLKCNKIATGHQLDDHIETILLNLMRGTKAKGLAGIPTRRNLSDAQRQRTPEVIRPLLCLTRAEIVAYLKFFKHRYAVDASNVSEDFTRNWIRRKVVPLLEKRNPNIRGNLSAIAEDLQDLITASSQRGRLRKRRSSR